MDSGEVVGVALEHGNGDRDRDRDSDVTPPMDKENEKVDNGIEILQVSNNSDNMTNLDGSGPNSTEVEVDTVSTVSDSKSPNLPKKVGAVRGDALKNGKTVKDQKGIRKGPTTIAQKKIPTLSQSLSFPSRGGVMPKANGLKKSIDGKQSKQGTEVNGTDSKPSVYARLSHPTRRVSTGATPVEAKSSVDGVTARRATLSSVPSMKQSVSKKYSSLKASVNGPASDVSLSHDQSSNSTRLSLPTKDDDDARSATSSTTPRGTRRNSGSGFAFRLDERAEKRKEFYSKIEEKIHAKEVERNNLQAKSKESQEEAIKQLRKNLTFKATPMPTFYKEPPPPKTELKKIPSTRPISPKLGRHKSSVGMAESSGDGTGSCQSAVSSSSANPSKLAGKGAQVNSNGDTVSVKKTFGRSLSRVPSQKSATTKSETKLLIAKNKTRESELETQRGEEAEVKTSSKSADVLTQETEPTEFKTDNDLIEKAPSNSGSQEIEPVEVSADKGVPENPETNLDATESVLLPDEIASAN